MRSTGDHHNLLAIVSLDGQEEVQETMQIRHPTQQRYIRHNNIHLCRNDKKYANVMIFCKVPIDTIWWRFVLQEVFVTLTWLRFEISWTSFNISHFSHFWHLARRRRCSTVHRRRRPMVFFVRLLTGPKRKTRDGRLVVRVRYCGE